MTIQECLFKAKNRVSFACIRSAEIRKEGNSISQSEAMTQANKEWYFWNVAIGG